MRKTQLCLSLLLALACGTRPKPEEVESRLKRTMSEFLYQSVNNDSSKVKFEVKQVIYFADKEFYECEFKVKMLQAGHDTIAGMKARVAKDFSKVVRVS